MCQDVLAKHSTEERGVQKSQLPEKNMTQCLMTLGSLSSINGPATRCSRDLLRWTALAHVTCIVHPPCPFTYFHQAERKAHEPAVALLKTVTIEESLTFQVCNVFTLEAELKTTNPKCFMPVPHIWAQDPKWPPAWPRAAWPSVIWMTSSWMISKRWKKKRGMTTVKDQQWITWSPYGLFIFIRSFLKLKFGHLAMFMWNILTIKGVLQWKLLILHRLVGQNTLQLVKCPWNLEGRTIPQYPFYLRSKGWILYIFNGESIRRPAKLWLSIKPKGLSQPEGVEEGTTKSRTLITNQEMIEPIMVLQKF